MWYSLPKVICSNNVLAAFGHVQVPRVGGWVQSPVWRSRTRCNTSRRRQRRPRIYSRGLLPLLMMGLWNSRASVRLSVRLSVCQSVPLFDSSRGVWRVCCGNTGLQHGARHQLRAVSHTRLNTGLLSARVAAGSNWLWFTTRWLRNVTGWLNVFIMTSDRLQMKLQCMYR